MKLWNAFMRLCPLFALASLRTGADLDLSDYGTQHELALGTSDTRLGFQPTNEGIETLRADAIDDHRGAGSPGEVESELTPLALGQPPLELGGIGAGRQADVNHGAHVT